MLRVLESESNRDAMLESLAGRPVYLHALYADPVAHPAASSQSLVYVAALDTGDEYLLPLSQADCDCPPRARLRIRPSECFVYDLKQYLYRPAIEVDPDVVLDARLFMYYHENVVADGTADAARRWHRVYGPDAFRLAPTLRLYEDLRATREAFAGVHAENPVTREYVAYDRALNYAFYTVESAGLAVDPGVFALHWPATPVGGMLYSRYNFYTATGRPSNAFGGVNFAALNKASGARASFVSRHGVSGRLVQMDFSAYHPRLISRLVGYPLAPGADVYAHLARYYTGKPDAELTADDVKQAKVATFAQMYGAISQRYEGVPYFQAISKYIAELWHRFEHYGYVETPMFRRKLRSEYYEDMSPSKLFNYVVQAFETERNVVVLYRLAELLAGRQSRMALYTYDSVLIDYHMGDGPELLREAASVMEEGYFPVKVAVGKNYHEMEELEPQGRTN